MTDRCTVDYHPRRDAHPSSKNEGKLVHFTICIGTKFSCFLQSREQVWFWAIPKYVCRLRGKMMQVSDDSKSSQFPMTQENSAAPSSPPSPSPSGFVWSVFFIIVHIQIPLGRYIRIFRKSWVIGLMQSYTHNCTPCLIVKSMFLPACFSNFHAPLSFWPNHIIFWDAIQFSHYPTRNHTLCLPDKSSSVNTSISHHTELYIYTYSDGQILRTSFGKKNKNRHSGDVLSMGSEKKVVRTQPKPILRTFPSYT